MDRWEISIDNHESRRKVALMEGRARPAEAPEEEEAEFSLTFYADQISLNIPASTIGRKFIQRLIEILGPPRMEPTIKCSCSWGDGVMGAMLLVLWDCSKENQGLQDLHAFLGVVPASLK